VSSAILQQKRALDLDALGKGLGASCARHCSGSRRPRAWRRRCSGL